MPETTTRTPLSEAVERALRHAIAYQCDGPVFEDKAAARMAVALADQQLADLLEALREIHYIANECELNRIQAIARSAIARATGEQQ